MKNEANSSQSSVTACMYHVSSFSDGHDRGQILLERLAIRWGPGPWADEPNRELWKAHGLDCLVNRNALGAWCGYVGVPKGHPYYGLSYRDLYERGLYPDVHGGLTYSDHCQGEICHPHDEGEAPVFWFGFDCAHAFDLVPAIDSLSKYNPKFPKDLFLVSRDVYRNIAYAKAQTERLAEQLAGVS